MTSGYITTRDTPGEISTSVLDRAREALLSGDFDEFSTCYELPLAIETFEGELLVETTDGLYETFRAVREFLRRHNVTHIAPGRAEAEFRGCRTIAVSYTSRLLSGSMIVGEAVPCLATLRLGEDGWRLQSTQYAVQRAPGLSAALIGRSRQARPTAEVVLQAL